MVIVRLAIAWDALVDTFRFFRVPFEQACVEAIDAGMAKCASKSELLTRARPLSLQQLFSNAADRLANCDVLVSMKEMVGSNQ